MPDKDEDSGDPGDRDVESIVVGVEQMNVQQKQDDMTNWHRTGVEPVTGDVSVIQNAKASAMPEPDDADIPEEDIDDDDMYVDDGVVAPVLDEGDDDP
ncbi:hypothetical protein BRADI_2g35231v3 [Brachypodium distachyon]|uniref:Uncharacterized protein n=1 Tax=Brachypodium distachyon TaxID=15368 RepID=A0A0Q3GA99_BRADI|nr:hypothetical protein BRADI_2g35231v3 [Brachypodium distachyon]